MVFFSIVFILYFIVIDHFDLAIKFVDTFRSLIFSHRQQLQIKIVVVFENETSSWMPSNVINHIMRMNIWVKWRERQREIEEFFMSSRPSYESLRHITRVIAQRKICFLSFYIIKRILYYSLLKYSLARCLDKTICKTINFQRLCNHLDVFLNLNIHNKKKEKKEINY